MKKSRLQLRGIQLIEIVENISLKFTRGIHARAGVKAVRSGYEMHQPIASGKVLQSDPTISRQTWVDVARHVVAS
jgi:hypothetical protein